MTEQVLINSAEFAREAQHLEGEVTLAQLARCPVAVCWRGAMRASCGLDAGAMVARSTLALP